MGFMRYLEQKGNQNPSKGHHLVVCSLVGALLRRRLDEAFSLMLPARDCPLSYLLVEQRSHEVHCASVDAKGPGLKASMLLHSVEFNLSAMLQLNQKCFQKCFQSSTPIVARAAKK